MRWRKVPTQMYAEARYRQLSRPQPNGQTLWMYLNTGPHTTSIPGLSCVGEMALSEALGWDREGFTKAFAELFEKGLAKADWTARVLWVPDAIQCNEPENPNVVLGWRTAAQEIPDCDLKREALAVLRDHIAFLAQKRPSLLEAFDKAFPELFGKGLPKPFGKSLANQEQEQEQEQESVSAAAATPTKQAPEPPLLPLGEVSGEQACGDAGAHRANGAKPKPAKREPSGNHQVLIDHFSEAWRKRYGEPYQFKRGRDGAAIKSILQQAGDDLPRCIGMVDAYLADNDKFFMNDRHSIGVLDSQLRKFLVPPSLAQPGRNGSVRKTQLYGEV